MTSAAAALSSERFARWLERHKRAVLAVASVHQFVIYFFFIGMPSWDGLTYRVPPIVELVQHGSFRLDRYEQWAFQAYVPFVELMHAPFMLVFKLSGVLIGAPLVWLPLCVYAAYRLVFRLTKDRIAALFGGAAFFALPVIGEGAFSGYVDFAVYGLFCAYLGALLGVLPAERSRRDLVIFAIATLFFTLARGQAVYAAGALLVVLTVATVVVLHGFRPRLRDGSSFRSVVAPFLAFGVGAIPCFGLQVWRYVNWGGPIYPYQFQLFGVAFGTGVRMKDLFTYAGIPDDSPKQLVLAFIHGWLWPSVWPPHAFYDSRHLGAGLLFWMTVALAVPALRALDLRGRALVATLVGLSVLARDYVHPRWSNGLIVTVVIVVGVGMARLLQSPRGRIAFAPLVLILGLHAFRPEYDLALLKADGIGMRLDAGSSRWFVDGRDAMKVWPDRHARYLIAQEKGFVLPVYGPNLTNEVIDTIPRAKIGPHCEGLIERGALEPDVFVIDDLDLTKDCDRVCAQSSWRCDLWHLTGSPQAALREDRSGAR